MASIKINVDITQTHDGTAHNVSFGASSSKCPDDRDAIPAFVAALVEKALAPYARLAAADAAKLTAALAELDAERRAKAAAQAEAKPEQPRGRGRRMVDDGGVPL